MDFHILCSDFKEKHNRFWRAVITARNLEENDGFRQHPGQEFIYVLSGNLELHSAYYDIIRLEPGDSMLFDADQPHAYVAPDGDCELLMMNTVMN